LFIIASIERKISNWTSHLQSSNLVVARSTRAGGAIPADEVTIKLLHPQPAWNAFPSMWFWQVAPADSGLTLPVG